MAASAEALTGRTDRPLQLLVKPVGSRCNLACSYCFYRHVPPSLEDAVMPGDVLERLVRSAMEARRPLTLFGWQGGEPTLAGLDFFRQAVRLQARFGAAGQTVGNALQTNGLLLDQAWCAFLTRWRFVVGLSLDGPREVHDRSRRHPDGGGSHEQVLRSLALLQRYDLALSVLVTVSRGDRAEVIYPWLRERGVASLQVVPVVERDGPVMAGFSLSPGEWGEFLCALFDLWWPERHGVRVREFDALTEVLLGRESPECVYGRSCDSYLLVEADGSVYPCDFFVRPDMRLGSLMETTPDAFEAHRGRLAFAARKSRLPRQPCGACPVRSLCRGGCLKDRERGGTLDGPSYLCRGLRTFIEHARPKLLDWCRELGGDTSAAHPAS